jgi:hypothetical protein
VRVGGVSDLLFVYILLRLPSPPRPAAVVVRARNFNKKSTFCLRAGTLEAFEIASDKDQSMTTQIAFG